MFCIMRPAYTQFHELTRDEQCAEAGRLHVAGSLAGPPGPPKCCDTANAPATFVHQTSYHTTLTQQNMAN